MASPLFFRPESHPDLWGNHSLQTLQKIKEAKEAQIKKEAKEAHQNKKNMREKERRDNATILFPHLCFKVAPWSS